MIILDYVNIECWGNKNNVSQYIKRALWSKIKVMLTVGKKTFSLAKFLSWDHFIIVEETVCGGQGGFRKMQVMVRSLGWCELCEEDLTSENSSKAVNRCIVDLSSKECEADKAGVWLEGRDLVLELDEGSLKLIEPDSGRCLNSQPIHAIRVWGVGRDNGRDFAYVSRDKQSRKHMCHVFRCELPARAIANALRDICKKILIERSLAQSSSRLTEKLISDKRDRQSSRPTSLGVETAGQAKLAHKLSRPVTETFPTPMEEPRKVIKASYLGTIQVDSPGGMEVINTAINQMMEKTPREEWSPVTVAVAPSTVSISFSDERESLECRVRFLSFLGIGQNVEQAAFIMHTAQVICSVGNFSVRNYWSNLKVHNRFQTLLNLVSGCCSMKLHLSIIQ